MFTPIVHSLSNATRTPHAAIEEHKFPDDSLSCHLSVCALDALKQSELHGWAQGTTPYPKSFPF